MLNNTGMLFTVEKLRISACWLAGGHDRVLVSMVAASLQPSSSRSNFTDGDGGQLGMVASVLVQIVMIHINL